MTSAAALMWAVDADAHKPLPPLRRRTATRSSPSIFWEATSGAAEARPPRPRPRPRPRPPAADAAALDRRGARAAGPRGRRPVPAPSDTRKPPVRRRRRASGRPRPRLRRPPAAAGQEEEEERRVGRCAALAKWDPFSCRFACDSRRAGRVGRRGHSCGHDIPFFWKQSSAQDRCVADDTWHDAIRPARPGPARDG